VLLASEGFEGLVSSHGNGMCQCLLADSCASWDGCVGGRIVE
jgi:hypothetical protein